MITPREKIPSTENIPRGGSKPRRCGQRAQALPTELFRPPECASNTRDVLEKRLSETFIFKHGEQENTAPCSMSVPELVKGLVI